MLRQSNLDLDNKYIRSYATEARLLKRIEEVQDDYPEYDDRCHIVRTPSGRWTALVQLDRNVGGYAGRYTGFVVI
jgi:hypothetical protein